MKHTPLTRAQLREIQGRYLSNPDVMALLREIKRYQDVILEVHPVFGLWGQADDDTLDQVERVQGIVDSEPCVAERSFDRTMASADGISQKRNTFPRAPRYESGFDID